MIDNDLIERIACMTKERDDLRAALFAEREACAAAAEAVISDGITKPFYAPEHNGDHPADSYGNAVAKRIAAAIRNRSKP